MFCSHLAAAGETLVIVRRPARTMSVVLVLKKTSVGVFLEFLGVCQQHVIQLGLLHLGSGSRLAAVWNVDLRKGNV